MTKVKIVSYDEGTINGIVNFLKKVPWEVSNSIIDALSKQVYKIEEIDIPKEPKENNGVDSNILI